jgi:hypothetical protein
LRCDTSHRVTDGSKTGQDSDSKEYFAHILMNIISLPVFRAFHWMHSQMLTEFALVGTELPSSNSWRQTLLPYLDHATCYTPNHKEPEIAAPERYNVSESAETSIQIIT